MSITTLKLFETLLTKPNEQIINNLVLRNLLGRSYVTMETIDSGHHSPTPDEQGHHHDNHNNTDSLHGNNDNAGQGQSQVGVSEGEADETSETNTEQQTLSQTSPSSEIKEADNSQNMVPTEQNQRDSEEKQEQEQKTSSELLTHGATITTASSEEKSSPSDKISNDNGDSENKTDEPGKDNAKGSEQSVKSDAEAHRQRHHSDFESELDEILGRVSSSSEGDATRETRADSFSRAKSSSQTVAAGAVEEEAQLVSRYGNIQFIQ